MKFRRRTLRANVPLASRTPSKPAGTKNGELPLLSQAEVLVTGLISLSQLVLRSFFLGFALLFRNRPAEVINDLTERQRILSTLLLLTTGAGIFAVCEPMTNGDAFDPFDWINTAMAGSQSPNFFARFGCALAVGLLLCHAHACIFGFGRSTKEKTTLQTLGAIIYMLSLACFIFISLSMVIGRNSSFIPRGQFHELILACVWSPWAVLSLGAGISYVRVALAPPRGAQDGGNRARLMRAVVMGATGIAWPTIAIICAAMGTIIAEDLADQAKDRAERADLRPTKVAFRPIGVDCANDRSEDSVMNCVFVANMKRSTPFSFDIGASNLTYTRSYEEAFGQEYMFRWLSHGIGPLIENGEEEAYESKETLVGKSGFHHAGDAETSQHVVTLQPDQRLILRLRLKAPEDCHQFARSDKLRDVYIRVRPMDQILVKPDLSGPPFLFIGPWRFDEKQIRSSHCGES